MDTIIAAHKEAQELASGYNALRALEMAIRLGAAAHEAPLGGELAQLLDRARTLLLVLAGEVASPAVRPDLAQQQEADWAKFMASCDEAPDHWLPAQLLVREQFARNAAKNG